MPLLLEALWPGGSKRRVEVRALDALGVRVRERVTGAALLDEEGLAVDEVGVVTPVVPQPTPTRPATNAAGNASARILSRDRAKGRKTTRSADAKPPRRTWPPERHRGVPGRPRSRARPPAPSRIARRRWPPVPPPLDGARRGSAGASE